MRRRIALLLVMLLVVAARFAAAAEPTTRPVAAITHAVVISVDGLRPDVLLRSNTPNMHGMMDEGFASGY